MNTCLKRAENIYRRSSAKRSKFWFVEGSTTKRSLSFTRL